MDGNHNFTILLIIYTFSSPFFPIFVRGGMAWHGCLVCFGRAMERWCGGNGGITFCKMQSFFISFSFFRFLPLDRSLPFFSSTKPQTTERDRERKRIKKNYVISLIFCNVHASRAESSRVEMWRMNEWNVHLGCLEIALHHLSENYESEFCHHHG